MLIKNNISELVNLLLLALVATFLGKIHALEVTVKMPGVVPEKNDDYLCFGQSVANETLYLKEFHPVLSKHIHHAAIFGCKDDADTNKVYRCDEMNGVCRNSQLLYIWAMNASPLKLPNDISVKVGSGSNIKSLVLQLHFKDSSPFSKDKTLKDKSGIAMSYETSPTKYFSGIYVSATDGFLPPRQRIYMDTACRYTLPVTLYPFRYRTHGHSHAELNSGYVIKDKNDWFEIGRKSPQLPESFYPVKKPVPIEADDIIAARCVMNNNEDRFIKIGSTRNDEMCNFYIMFYVNANDIDLIYENPNEFTCVSPGYPNFSWDNIFSSYPSESITDPKTENVLKRF